MPENKLEVRALDRFELRAAEDGDSPGTLIGYAAKFNAWSQDLGWFREKIAPGAFSKTLQNDDQVALASHEQGPVPLGRRSAGTLKLSEDAVGLRFELALPDTTLGRDLAVSIGRGDIRGMSFGFNVVRAEWNFDPDPQERTLHEVELHEISTAVFPAYPDTSVAVREMRDQFRGAKTEAATREIAPEIAPAEAPKPVFGPREALALLNSLKPIK